MAGFTTSFHIKPSRLSWTDVALVLLTVNTDSGLIVTVVSSPGPTLAEGIGHIPRLKSIQQRIDRSLLSTQGCLITLVLMSIRFIHRIWVHRASCHANRSNLYCLDWQLEAVAHEVLPIQTFSFDEYIFVHEARKCNGIRLYCTCVVLVYGQFLISIEVQSGNTSGRACRLTSRLSGRSPAGLTRGLIRRLRRGLPSWRTTGLTTRLRSWLRAGLTAWLQRGGTRGLPRWLHGRYTRRLRARCGSRGESWVRRGISRFHSGNKGWQSSWMWSRDQSREC